MTAREWTLTVPAPYKMLSANGNKPWRETARAKREWRNAVYQHAIAARVPVGLRHIRVDVLLRFTTVRHRDAPNYYPFVAKPCVDALAGSRRVRDERLPGGWRVESGRGVVPNDTTEFVDGPHIDIGEPVPYRQHPYGLALITITDLSGDGHA